MEKLQSVSEKVEHSSTIVSDILSRILNETVMREETICRICFNLLNDIDYHLKEAQEKTGEKKVSFLFLLSWTATGPCRYRG
jgi:predicted transcriptional regulator